MDRVPADIFAIYFSPYTAHAIEINGVVYPTVEHAYQCARYADPKIIAEILAARSPVKAWETSTKYKHLQIPDFRNCRREVMKSLMRERTLQHKEVMDALLATGHTPIINTLRRIRPAMASGTTGQRARERTKWVKSGWNCAMSFGKLIVN
jgi:predicted NAD-dependent protein-ADP-ribosyltransferase YbiA (DUF1768 family)